MAAVDTDNESPAGVSPAPDKSYLKEKKRIEQAGRFHWVHWAIILSSLILTIVAWRYAKAQNDVRVSEQFDREATQVVDLISERMSKYEDILWGAVAATKASPNGMPLSSWKQFSTTLQIEMGYPGINGIGLIDYVKPDDLEAYLAEQRAERPDFKVFPQHTRKDLLPIVYIEPVSLNAAAVGLDVAHETNRYMAAMKARDTGEAQITGPIILVQDAKKTPGFLFYTPYYEGDNPQTLSERQETFVGMAYAPFIFERLMDGALGAEQRRVGLKITDGDDVLFDESDSPVDGAGRVPAFETQISQNVYGRDWTYEVWSRPSFEATTVNNKPQLILLSGLLIEALIIGLFLLLTRSNRRAIRFAKKMASAQNEQAARMDNILENAVDGIMTVTEQGIVASYNKACQGIFGFKAEKIIGSSIDNIIPTFSQAYKDIYREKRNSENFTPDTPKVLKSLELEGICCGTVKKPLEMSVSEISQDGNMLFNIIVRDISRRKAAELERNRAMEDLMLSNQDLEKFAYSASHDLKSPLRAIDNLSKWIEEDLGDKIDEENRGRISMLRGRVTRMEKLLNGLLQYSRAGQKYEKSDKVKVIDIFKDVTKVIDIPDHFKVTLDDSLIGIEVERMPLEQIFHNLLSNAIKHHDKEAGRVIISANFLPDYIEFSIRDDGPGIDPRFQEKVFGMFQTLKRRDEVEGSGMGLALVKKLVHHHGGKIRIESEPGKGSTFIVTWPKNPRARSVSAA